jgi:hypothetical protein
MRFKRLVELFEDVAFSPSVPETQTASIAFFQASEGVLGPHHHYRFSAMLRVIKMAALTDDPAFHRTAC